MHRCIDEERAVRLAAGLIEATVAEQLVAEVESCAACRALLIEAGIALKESTGSVQSELVLGQRLLGRYEVHRRLGRGGMGEVFAVFDRERAQVMALKTIRAELSHHPKVVARFRQELHLASKVAHPNVARVFDYGTFTTPEGTLTQYFTLELLQGQPLARWRRSVAPTLAQALGIARQVAAGLAAIHAQGIVHRDLKPENVMICDEGPQLRAVVLDFGVARSQDRVLGLDTTSFGARLGTPDFMAPEVLRGRPASMASDVYSFGLLVYELLSGRHPWPDRGTRAALSALGELELTPLQTLCPALSPALCALVTSCLQDLPERRPGSGAELAQALQSVSE